MAFPPFHNNQKRETKNNTPIKEPNKTPKYNPINSIPNPKLKLVPKEILKIKYIITKNQNHQETNIALYFIL